jgi:hypothetical protein
VSVLTKKFGVPMLPLLDLVGILNALEIVECPN